MSATVLLLKTQARLLAWPLLLVLAAWLINALVPQDDTVDFLIGITVVLAAALSGPIVFGAEYAEGARDYLSTRPIAPWKVFWSKTLLLVAVAWLCALIVGRAVPVQEILEWDLFQVVEKPARLLFPIVLAMSFWGAFCTVLCRDLVRGLLYGGISFTILAALLGALQWMFFEAYRPQFTISFVEYQDPYIQAYVFESLFLAMAPFPILGLLQSLYASQTAHRFRLGWILPVGGVLMVGAVSLAAYSMKNEGNATLHVYGRGTGMAAASIRGGRLLAVFKDQDKVWFRSLDLTDPELYQDHEWRSHTGALDIAQDGVIVEDTVILFPSKPDRREYDVAFYRIEDASSLRLIRLFENVQWSWVTPEGALSVIRADKSPPFLVNLATGEVGDVTTTARFQKPRESIRVGERVFSNLPGEFYLSTNQGRGEFLAAPAVDEDLIAGFQIDLTPGQYRLGYQKLPALLPYIQLNSLPIKRSSSISTIPIPDRLIEIFRKVSFGLALFRMSPVRVRDLMEGTYVRLTLGGGYLCLWASEQYNYLNRVAVWDVSEPQRPEFLGIFPSNQINTYNLTEGANSLIQPPLVPIERKDGAIGFPIYGNQILWLEIPGRMKEPQT